MEPEFDLLNFLNVQIPQNIINESNNEETPLNHVNEVKILHPKFPCPRSTNTNQQNNEKQEKNVAIGQENTENRISSENLKDILKKISANITFQSTYRSSYSPLTNGPTSPNGHAKTIKKVQQIKKKSPNGQNIIFEIHEVDIPSNHAINQQLAKYKQEQKNLEKSLDIEYSNMIKKEVEEIMNRQKNNYLQQKKQRILEYEEWKKSKTLSKKQTKEQIQQENKLIKEYYETLNRMSELEREEELNRKRRMLEEYKNNLKSQIESKKKQIDKAFCLTSLPIKTSELSPEDQSKRKQSFREFWKKQLENKQKQEHLNKEKERQEFNKSLKKELIELQKHLERYRQQQNYLKEKIKKDLQMSLDLKRKREREEIIKKQKEIEERIKQEQLYKQELQKAKAQKIAMLQQRKKDLDRQVSETKSIKQKEKSDELKKDLDMLKNDKPVLTVKLFKCAETKKILPAMEFNNLVPRNEIRTIPISESTL